jgi:hypothetical protein
VTYTILAQKSDLRMAMVPIDELKPHEKGSPLYLRLIRKELLKDGVLRYPIIADEETLVILDGMHRWLALKSLGCTLVPAILINARQDPRIRIGKRRIHRYEDDSQPKITVDRVISAGLSGRLMKPKSTRHFFPFSKFQQINYPLQLLGRKAPQDVSKYLARMTDKKCSLVFEDWLAEISEELNFLTRRKEEVEKEKSEFLSRIRSLDDNVRFL